MRVGRWSVLLVMALSSLASGRQLQWYELYDQAVSHIQRAQRATQDAVRDQEWKQAETKLQQALKANPGSGRNVWRYGMLYDDYFPQFYLGIVYLNTDRPGEAGKAFAQARQQKLNTQDAEFRNLAALEKQAADMVEKTRLATANPAGPGGGTTGSADPLGRGGTTGTGGITGAGAEVPPVPARQQFDELMKRAQTAMAQANYAEAEKTATAARDLNVDRAAADALVRNITGARLGDRVENALKSRDGIAARRELDALVVAVPDAPMVPALRDRVTTLERDIRRAVFERDAMKAFFTGGYQRALTLLDQAEKNVQLSPRGRFYRACSLAALVAASGNLANDRRLPEARKQYAASSPGSNQFSAETRYISPKILQLLRGS